MVDYSKWKNIEVSDDEDDVHPNIDTPSLFRWRHQARVDRMEELQREKEKVELEKKEVTKKKSQLEKLAAAAEVVKGHDGGGDASSSSTSSTSKLKAEVELMKKKEEEILEKQEELEKRERLAPWNIDTIGKDGFSKTVINVPKKLEKEKLSDEEKGARLKKFTKENESLLKKYGMLRRYEDTKRFLLENQHLACEESSSYLVLWCINLALEEKFDLLDHVSHQCIAMEFLLNLAKQLDVDPRSCIANFFTKLGKLEDTEYKTDFDKELFAFRERIRRRAEEKIEEARQEEEEEMMAKAQEQEKVLNSLPSALKNCFVTQDIPLLQQTLKTMDLKEARKHMMRCTKVGLWVPDPNSGLKEFEVDEDEVDEEDQAIYEEIKNQDNPDKPTKDKDNENDKSTPIELGK